LTPVRLTSLSGRSAGEGYKEFKEFGRMERALVMNVYHAAPLQLKTENIDIRGFAIIIVSLQFTYGGNMNTDYKGYTIITASERDDASGLWNGRYRIMDDEGIVVYESFVEPLHDEDKAYEAANVAARAWIDGQ
jgi:hypothetical protein